jgi:hypothetical protein
MKIFKYTNFDGRRKALVVKSTDTENEYYIEIWNLDTGDFCGNGRKTAESIKKFLAQYGVKI